MIPDYSYEYEMPDYAEMAAHGGGGGGGLFSGSDMISKFLSISFMSSFLGVVTGGGGADGNAAFMNSLRLVLLGALLEGGRRLFRYVSERFKLFQYSINALFTEGDPAYEWLILLLTEEKVWSRSRDFRVTASSSARKWNVNVSDTNAKPGGRGHVDYVPTYQEAQLFKWRGYWVEIRRNSKSTMTYSSSMGQQVVSSMFLTIYTRDMSVLADLVDDARERYLKSNKPHVIVFSADQPNFGPGSTWTNAKRKQRRPLSSIILQDNVIETLVEDAREFMRSEDWYTKAGIPHRRGYLLHGPPGTGKSSTIYAVAGELGLEIYTLSLSASFVDDAFLARAVASIPKQAIFLIEDIDCAFPSREEGDDDEDDAPKGAMMYPPGMVMPRGVRGGQRSPVTMSGLLNVLDGVGSEEGKVFFATTNYIDRLDPALLRPGRIDLKFEYKLATQAQASALFLRFFPESHTTLSAENPSSTSTTSEKTPPALSVTEKEAILQDMAGKFSSQVPEHEFSTAELQGFLLGYKQQPEKAVQAIAEWVRNERRGREEKRRREEERAAKKRDKKETKQARELQGTLAKLGSMGMHPFPGGSPGALPTGALNGNGNVNGASGGSSTDGSPGVSTKNGAKASVDDISKFMGMGKAPLASIQTPYGMMVPPPNVVGAPMGPSTAANGASNSSTPPAYNSSVEIAGTADEKNLKDGAMLNGSESVVVVPDADIVYADLAKLIDVPEALLSPSAAAQKAETVEA